MLHQAVPVVDCLVVDRELVVPEDCTVNPQPFAEGHDAGSRIPDQVVEEPNTECAAELVCPPLQPARVAATSQAPLRLVLQIAVDSRTMQLLASVVVAVRYPLVATVSTWSRSRFGEM
jgi:hypothetical protein